VNGNPVDIETPPATNFAPIDFVQKDITTTDAIARNQAGLPWNDLTTSCGHLLWQIDAPKQQDSLKSNANTAPNTISLTTPQPALVNQHRKLIAVVMGAVLCVGFIAGIFLEALQITFPIWESALGALIVCTPLAYVLTRQK
jgi:hypothetical protein